MEEGGRPVDGGRRFFILAGGNRSAAPAPAMPNPKIPAHAAPLRTPPLHSSPAPLCAGPVSLAPPPPRCALGICCISSPFAPFAPLPSPQPRRCPAATIQNVPCGGLWRSVPGVRPLFVFSCASFESSCVLVLAFFSFSDLVIGGGGVGLGWVGLVFSAFD